MMLLRICVLACLAAAWTLGWTDRGHTDDAGRLRGGGIVDDSPSAPGVGGALETADTASAWDASVDLGARAAAWLAAKAGPVVDSRPQDELGEAHPLLPHPSDAFLARLRSDAKAMAYYKGLADRYDPGKAGENGTHGLRGLLVYFLATQDTRYLAKVKTMTQIDEWPNLYQMREPLAQMAIAYDWLYRHLDDDTRAALLAEIIERCAEWKRYYQSSRMSPYNDMVYIRQGWSIFAAAPVAYLDAPDKAKTCYAFAQDVLVNRYLPVWRQIMEGGGWHEGAEYVSLGIGEVVTPILSSWGSAHGRDLFRENPWLADFIKYPIYTTRPDGTALRIADTHGFLGPSGVAFQALPVIYDDPYGRFWKRHISSGPFAPASATISPGYPWVEPDLPEANERSITALPLMHHFTGWGTVIMRGGWDEDDIYASFRIGDNYWSHQHADAGAFTIYRRGALAIDSGTYNTDYGAEHHYMYAMQAIAHNTVLVHDPRDYYPDYKAVVFVAPNEKARLPYPNDGGQRRVGSGGYNSSPDDIDAWRAEIDDYEFGNITLIAHDSDYTVAAGDLDAAYNNRNSGTGDPTDRTKRVKDYQRYFVYLRPGYFAVFDRIEAYGADFEKTWLVHAINEPDIDGDQITITRADTVRHKWTWGDLEHRQKDKSLYRYDGRLFAKTVLPREAQITKIGGDGRQFWVDGRNYDGSRSPGGVKWMTAPPTEGPPEPGAWRIEVSPERQQTKDLFLHVLYPTLSTTTSMPDVRAIEADTGGMTGAHIAANFENPQWLVMFNGSVGTVDSVSYSLQGEGRCKQLFTDMVPRKRYTVKQNGKPVTAVTADDQGIVFFAAELTGTDTFELD